MVVSGVPIPTRTHAMEVANMAIDLVNGCKTFAVPHKPGESLKIRVGLHSGTFLFNSYFNFTEYCMIHVKINCG